MTEDPVDLSALDPTQPCEAFAVRLAAVRYAARDALARRRTSGQPLFFVARWRAPLMAALLLVTLVSAALLRSAQADVTLEPDATDEIAEALGFSTPAGAAFLTGSTSPTAVLLGGLEQ